jgi:hypothetical protein
MAVSECLQIALRNALKDQGAIDELITLLNIANVLSSTEAGFIDGVTPGTVVANKAVVPTTSRVIDALTITAGNITTLAGSTGNTYATTAGTGITGGTGTVIKYAVYQFGTLIYSAIYIDLTGLQAIATDGDIIGDSTNPAYLGQITAARNGTVDMGLITCMEAPAGGSADINFVTAVENTLKKDDASSGGTGVQTLVDAAGNWTNGLAKGILNTPITANNYLYLTNGAGAGAGTYTAGKFLIEFFGF